MENFLREAFFTDAAVAQRLNFAAGLIGRNKETRRKKEEFYHKNKKEQCEERKNFRTERRSDF